MAKQRVSAADRSIGQRIQQRRRELGITAAELSEKMGFSQQQLSRYERGTNKINVAHLVNIAAFLDVPIGWFFLDCRAEVPIGIGEYEKRYVPATEADLRKRLDQRWRSFSQEQQRSLIVFLDSLDLPGDSR